MEGETALASKRHGVAGGEAERSGRRVALKAADAKHRRIPERQRDDGGGQLLLVAVLVQAHPRGRVIEIDEAGLRRRRAGRDGREGGEKRSGIAGHGRPVSGWVG